MQSFTEKLFNAMELAGSFSQNSGLTAAQLADRFRLNRKNTSTVLGTLARRKLMNRSLEEITPGMRREYRYWLVRGKFARFNNMRGDQHVERAEAPAETVKHLGLLGQLMGSAGIGAEGYVLCIRGPNDFNMVVTLKSDKLAGVIAAANGG